VHQPDFGCRISLPETAAAKADSYVLAIFAYALHFVRRRNCAGCDICRRGAQKPAPQAGPPALHAAVDAPAPVSAPAPVPPPVPAPAPAPAPAPDLHRIYTDICTDIRTRPASSKKEREARASRAVDTSGASRKKSSSRCWSAKPFIFAAVILTIRSPSTSTASQRPLPAGLLHAQHG